MNFNKLKQHLLYGLKLYSLTLVLPVTLTFVAVLVVGIIGIKTNIEIDSDGFNSKQIPRLLNTVYYDVIKEESWNFVKEFKNPTINYVTLQHFVFAQVKKCMPSMFS